MYSPPKQKDKVFSPFIHRHPLIFLHLLLDFHLQNPMESSLLPNPKFPPFKPKSPSTLISLTELKPKTLIIRSAISRTKKEQTIQTIQTNLTDCHLIAGIRYKGLTVRNLQDLRRSLPETTTLLVAKNTLVGKAVENTPWDALKPCMKGMNAWLFVHSEEIPEGLKPYRKFQKEKKLEENDFTGAVFEGRFYGPDEFKALETMPSRAEIYSKLLGVVQGPAVSVVSTLQAPARELVMTLKAYVKKLEEEQGGLAA